ncbi:MAG TPA: hypothetical protein ENJ11_07630 [Gammaproteobacteria bacterium]|nr:hypothetical protein [Gammaproteobacteria bacterium]
MKTGYIRGLKKSLFLLSLVLAAQTAIAADVKLHKNPQSGLYTWKVDDDGFSIELIQLVPDFVRAVYGKQNFPKNEIERIASYCVFGTILKNTSNQHLSYRVKDWRYRTRDGKTWPVKTKTQWLEEWEKAGIVFSWTLLPDIGEFAEGDWQQGFTTIKLPRESAFDFIYTWKLDGVAHEGVIKNMRCAPETLPLETDNHE